MKPPAASRAARRSPIIRMITSSGAGASFVIAALGLGPERAPRRHRLTQHVAGGQVQPSPLQSEITGLSPLARARRPEKRDSRAQLPYPLERDLDFFRKPS